MALNYEVKKRVFGDVYKRQAPTLVPWGVDCFSGRCHPSHFAGIQGYPAHVQ